MASCRGVSNRGRMLVATIMSALLLALLLAVPSVAQTSALPPGGTFWDDDGSTHEGMIEAIVLANITSGCSSDGRRYCPAAPVTRAQMATFLSRALDLPPADRDYFTDDDGNRHEDAINRVAAAGIATGPGGGLFEPHAPVTRAQMATFLANGFELPAFDGTNRFQDVRGTHAANINRVAAAGITTGCDSAGKDYCPTPAVLRGQMASFLGRSLGLTAVVPPTRALTEGVQTVRRYMDALTEDDYAKGRRQSTGVARRYIDYLDRFTRIEGTFGGNEAYRVTRTNSTATSLGDRRWRLDMVVEWVVDFDGEVDTRELRTFVVAQQADGTFRVQTYHRNGLPMSAFVRTGTIASSASGKPVTAKLVAQFRQADASRPWLYNILEVTNHSSATVTLNNYMATYTTLSDNRVYWPDGDIGPFPAVRPGQTISMVLNAAEIRAPHSSADLVFEASRSGFAQDVRVRVPTWPR